MFVLSHTHNTATNRPSHLSGYFTESKIPWSVDQSICSSWVCSQLIGYLWI